MKPLVSILIPAYNAEDLIAYTIESAIDQTWKHREIIIVNDGSTDRTAEIAQRFASKEVKVVTTENRGLSGAVNHAYSLCQGDYIQELDSDDLLAPDKIERQLGALREGDSKRTLLSSPWAYFYYRTRRAKFIPNSMWHDLSPTDWLLRKFSENLHMQNATWLVSRELAEAAGPWDASLHYDQDGEYFARVLSKSEGTRFVPEGRVFYRMSSAGRISHIGNSTKKKNSLFLSMKLQIGYLRSLEDTERARRACVIYLQNWYRSFHPDQQNILMKVQGLAAELGGRLEEPQFGWKYAWMKPLFGSRSVMALQDHLGEMKMSLLRRWDESMFKLETREASH